jgi:hypothetical protein
MTAILILEDQCSRMVSELTGGSLEAQEPQIPFTGNSGADLHAPRTDAFQLSAFGTAFKTQVDAIGVADKATLHTIWDSIVARIPTDEAQVGFVEKRSQQINGLSGFCRIVASLQHSEVTGLTIQRLGEALATLHDGNGMTNTCVCHLLLGH